MPINPERHQNNDDLIQKVNTYKRAIATDPNNATTYAGLCESLFKLKQYDEAEAACVTALALDPNMVVPHRILGKLRGYQKRYPESEVEFKTAIELDPSSSDDYSFLASAFALQGKYQDAEHYLLHALELNPNSSSLNSDLSTIYGLKKQYKKSVRMAWRAYQLTPTFSNWQLLAAAVTVNKTAILGLLLLGFIILSLTFHAIWTVPLAVILLIVLITTGAKSLRTSDRSQGVLVLIGTLLFIVMYILVQTNGLSLH